MNQFYEGPSRLEPSMLAMTPCVRRLDFERDTTGGFTATVWGPDLFTVGGLIGVGDGVGE